MGACFTWCRGLHGTSGGWSGPAPARLAAFLGPRSTSLLPAFLEAAERGMSYGSIVEPSDTSPAIQARMDAAYLRMSPAEKMRRSAALSGLAHEFALARIRAERPHESSRQHRLRLASRWLSREQMIAAFGWDPEAQA